MRDRLEDLQQGGVSRSSESTLSEEKIKKKISVQKQKEIEDQSAAMTTFFNSINEIKGMFARIRGMLDQVKSLQGASLDAITEQQQEATQKELDDIMDKIQDLTKQIKTDLSDMESETKIIRSRTPKHQDLFIRDSQYSVLLKTFSEIIQEYKMVQEEHQARLRERLTKHALIVNPEASPEEVNQIMLGEKIFAPQSSLQKQEARNALEEIQKKHNEVTKLANSILELQQLFFDVTVLIQAQGDVLTRAAENVDKAAKDTDAGVVDLEMGVKIQKRHRRRLCQIIALLVVVVGLAVGIPALMGRF